MVLHFNGYKVGSLINHISPFQSFYSCFSGVGDTTRVVANIPALEKTILGDQIKLRKLEHHERQPCL